MNSPPGKSRAERPDGRLFLTEENLDRGTLTLLAAAKRVSVLLRHAAGETELSALEFDILMEIAHDPGLDVAQLRQRVGGTTPTIARLLAKLEKDGWIVRPKAERDGRRKALRLSESGINFVDGMLATIRKDMTHIYRQAGEPSVTGAMELLGGVSELSADIESS
tara:strand:- start:16683 stop:17177 length:495 start_codon:yes stop_codon:yes gene_type:complete